MLSLMALCTLNGNVMNRHLRKIVNIYKFFRHKYYYLDDFKGSYNSTAKLSNDVEVLKSELEAKSVTLIHHHAMVSYYRFVLFGLVGKENLRYIETLGYDSERESKVDIKSLRDWVKNN